MFAFECVDGWTVLTRRGDAPVPHARWWYDFTNEATVELRRAYGVAFPYNSEYNEAAVERIFNERKERQTTVHEDARLHKIICFV